MKTKELLKKLISGKWLPFYHSFFARAKIQERTPAFILVKGASMPIKPEKPKRMLFVLGMTLLAFLGTSAYVLKDILKSE